MTDAAVVADGAPAPDAPSGAVINENAPGFNSPLGSQIPPEAQAKAEPAKPVSLDDSIDRAMAKSAAKQAEAAKAPEPKADAKAEPVKEPARGEGGKFAAKEPVAEPKDAPAAKPAAEAPKPSHTAEDAPARFTETAKAKWASADPEIRGETLRMQKELTDGFQKYKQSAERDATLTEFHEMAAKSGTDVKSALQRYTALESLLRSDPVKGLAEVFNNLGISPRDYAAHVLGQKPEEQASQQDATIRELRQELAGLKQQVGNVTQTFEQQREQSTLTEIHAFAKMPEHSRFEELSSDIAFFMQSGRAKDLPEAYQLAERLNPVAGQAKDALPAASSAAPEPPVHPDKGTKSINGAPSAGSSPAGKKRVAKSLDEALDNAFRQTG